MSPEDQAAKQQLLDRVYQRGFEYEAKYGACPQCVLAALQEDFPFIDDAVFKASHPMSGGGGLSGEGTCGALSGGYLAIGNRYGRARQDFEQTRVRNSARLAKKLSDKFVAEFGSPVCGRVLEKMMGRSFDMWNEADRAAFDALGGHTTKCPDVVGKTARWAAELLLEEEGM